MGIAWQAEGEKLYIGTYGEWDSLIEGGTSIELVVEAPGGVPAAVGSLRWRPEFS
jgi:hypothetical protein